MGKEIHFYLAGKSGQNGLEVEDDQILFWSLIYENFSLVPKLWKNYNLTPKCILRFWTVLL